ncbi:MAG: type II toxin-antitoxin system Phd/YefM family antitoxin [Candidatus Bipolaricaulia bacterium]
MRQRSQSKALDGLSLEMYTAGAMAMTVTAKQLRHEMGRILKRVSAGEQVTVTLRGKPVAVIMPVETAPCDYDPIGFGLWKDREDLKDVQAWLDKIRQPRHRGK